ncbi:MAG: glycerate 2-kinase [Chloroflexota bacterium]|jgi:glycerate kinase|nr:glycerate 2-kinase [Chloroflexota bacterium]
MRVVVAPTAFKGTLGPTAAAGAIAAGLRRRRPDLEIDLVPIADGGDGFLESLEGALGAERRSVIVRGPVHAPLAAPFGLQAGNGLAIVEAALAVGLARLAAGELDPLGASSGGLGEVLAEARQAGGRTFLVGLGGSASTDGGTGMARALGYRFLDSGGAELPEGGGPLRRLDRIDASGFDPAWLLLDVTVGHDVDNPLLGPTGAAAVYAPQKGATPAQVEVLDEGLRRLADVVRRDLGIDIGLVPGGGAAGGLGAGFAAFLGARLTPGATLVLNALGMEGRLAGAGAMVTGEGRLDGQSLHGKAPVAVGRMARRVGIRSHAVVGSTGDGWEAALKDAFDSVVTAPVTAGDLADGAADRLEAAAASVDL